MTPLLQNTAEVAMIRSLGEQVFDNSNRGRMKNKSAKLVEESDKILVRLPKIENSEMKQIEIHLDKFFESTGWARKQKNIVTIIVFCHYIRKNSKFKYSKKLVNILDDMFDYRERAGYVKDACLWPGELAYNKWQALIN